MVVARGALQDEQPRPAGSLPVAIDCSSVIGGWKQRLGPGREGSFPYRGFFRSAFAAAAAPFKVDAHVPEFQAIRDGWHKTWKANDTADVLAKEARAKWRGLPREWLADRRTRTKLLGQLLESLAPDRLWDYMLKARPASARAGRGAASRERKVDGHLITCAGKGWACLVCGAAFRSHRSALASTCPGGLPAALEAHPSHCMHAAEFQVSGGPVQPLVFCSRCGAHGTARVANLTSSCPAADSLRGARGAPFRKQASLVKRGLHPSRKGVVLSQPRPLRCYLKERQAAWQEAHAVQPAASSTADAAARDGREGHQGGSGSALVAPTLQDNRCVRIMGSSGSSRPETVGNGGSAGEAPGNPQETVENCIDFLDELAELEAAAAACTAAPGTHTDSSTPLPSDPCIVEQGRDQGDAAHGSVVAPSYEEEVGDEEFGFDMGPAAYE